MNNFSRAFEVSETSKLGVKPFQKEPGLKLKLKPTQLLNSGSMSKSSKSVKDASPPHCKTPEEPQKPSGSKSKLAPHQPTVPTGLNIHLGNVYYQQHHEHHHYAPYYTPEAKAAEFDRAADKSPGMFMPF